MTLRNIVAELQGVPLTIERGLARVRTIRRGSNNALIVELSNGQEKAIPYIGRYLNAITTPIIASALKVLKTKGLFRGATNFLKLTIGIIVVVAIALIVLMTLGLRRLFIHFTEDEA